MSLEARTQKLIDSKDRATRTRAAFSKFLADRAQFENELSVLVEDGQFDLSSESVSRYSKAAGAVALADAMEPKIRAAAADAWLDLSGAIGQGRIDLADQYRVIDAEIRAAIEAKLPAEIRELTSIDHTKAREWTEEMAARPVVNDGGGSILNIRGTDCSADLILQYLDTVIAESKKIVAELARTEQVIGRYSRKAA